MTNPILSVVIPTRNRAYLVGEAIESALNQRPGEVEVIVVDDASTDDTAKVVAENFGSRVRLLRTPERRGAGAARNAGLRVARGELVAFLDDDDLWLPGKLDAELNALKQFPEADGVVSDSLQFVQGQVAPQSFFMRNGLLAATQGHVRWTHELPWLWTNSLNGVAMCSITLRRRVLDQKGEKWFAEDLVSCEDWELEMWVYHHWRIVALPEVWAWIRRLDDGVRVGRATPGQPPTVEQERLYLRDRLTVIERSHWLRGLRSDLAAELENTREDTLRRLARLESLETA
ncbi:MAG TPA: glycosyltransferase family A protein [Pyrinomonadaceae bacterium]|nr:glycosyltransferase family A protein [Pyrinomonadaceae bacterium]